MWEADASKLDDDGLYWVFAPKYRDKYESLAGRQWKFNFMGTAKEPNSEASALFCNKYPPSGQFGEVSSDVEVIQSLTSRFERAKYDDSHCSTTGFDGSYPKSPASPEPKWTKMSDIELDQTFGYDLNEGNLFIVLIKYGMKLIHLLSFNQIDIIL